MNKPDTIARVVSLLPDSVVQDNEPVFHEPWQAQAFAMAVDLLRQGRLQWGEWSATLGAEIADARANGFAEDGSDYYRLWLRALEKLVTEKELANAEELLDRRDAWREAYAHTPHGEVVALP